MNYPKKQVRGGVIVQADQRRKGRKRHRTKPVLAARLWVRWHKRGKTTQEDHAGIEAKGVSNELTVDVGNGVKLEMVLIPAGEFKMGSPDSDERSSASEKPQHRVRITRPFYLGKYLVTQEQWRAVMGKKSEPAPAGRRTRWSA